MGSESKAPGTRFAGQGKQAGGSVPRVGLYFTVVTVLLGAVLVAGVAVGSLPIPSTTVVHVLASRVLPAGWVDEGRTMVSIDDPADPSPYGAHWLGVRGETLETLNALGTFRASGYEGQTITICPALDLLLVRLGKTPHDNEDFLVPWRAAVVEAFARAA